MSTAELLSKQEYKYGFVTDIESDVIPRGLTEDTIRLIVEKKNEPEWMLEFRLKGFPSLADDDGAEALAQPTLPAD
jgi:Fe-S cluster assembly protein SufB